MADHNELGIMGEEIALEYLLKKGNKILKKNYRFGRNEVDLILKDQNEIVILEVKTRSNPFMAGPEKTVTRSKQRAIIQVAQDYVETHNMDEEVRFDIVSILIHNGETKVDHIKDAFYPTL